MNKYIDADRLKAKITDLCANANFYQQKAIEESNREDFVSSGGEISAYAKVLSLIDSLQQEQQEVDLEKFTEKIKTFQGRYKHPEIVSIKGAMAFMARMFYQYPNVARQWYDNLPKVTMD